MSIVTVIKNTYTVEPLYQWDLNQVLEIHGLSLPSIPEIHFSNDAMDRAIVRQAIMDDAGVITVDIPNSLLQKPYRVYVYVCIYEGETFQSLYKIVIPVKARNKPADYTITDTDGEVYSFIALENLVNNTARDLREEHDQLNAGLVAEHEALGTELRQQIADDLKNADDWAKNCEQAYFACYDAISNLGMTADDLNGGDPSTEDVTVDEDDLYGGTPG